MCRFSGVKRVHPHRESEEEEAIEQWLVPVGEGYDKAKFVGDLNGLKCCLPKGVHCSLRDSRKTLEHWRVRAGVKGKNLQVTLRGPDEKKLAHAAALLDNRIHHWIVAQPAYEGEHNTASAHKQFWNAVIHSI